MSIETFGHAIGIGSLVLQAMSLALLFVYFQSAKIQSLRPIRSHIKKHALRIAFVLVICSTLISLYASEILHLVPCGLCWLQRVFMYPQVLLLGIAIYKRSNYIADYIIGMSIVGAVIGIYQHYMQMGGTKLIECPISGAEADCAARLFLEFGYMTIPFMSAIAFVLIVILMIFARHTAR